MKTSLYGGRSQTDPLPESFCIAILLMIYEFVCYCIMVYLLWGKSKVNLFEYNNLPQKHFIYCLFFLVVVFLIIVSPSSLKMLSFVNPSISGSEHMTFSKSTLESFILYFIFTGKYLFFLVMLSYCYKSYIRSNEKKYYYIALLVLLFNLLTYYGLNRMDLVLPAIVSLLIFSKLFRDFSALPLLFYFVAIVVLVSIIGEARELSSYSEKINKQADDWVDIADFFQCYLGGVYNVAISVEITDYYHSLIDLKQLFFDIFRPFIGFNVFLKHMNVEFTNSFFNRRIWLSDSSSQIMPMIGQGWVHLGAVFSPILGILTILLAYWLEKIMNKVGRIEMNFFIGICLVRIGFFMGQNTSNIINEISMNLIMSGIVFYINNKISLER
ncbi:hypothetical protein [Phocaeicola sp.]